MSLDLAAFLKTKPRIALVGATTNTSKFGNIILRDLMGKGFTVLPVNPRATEIEGQRAYPTLTAASKDHEIGLVVFVLPPPLTLTALEEALALGLQRVWIQPGAADDAVRNYVAENEFEALIDACVMVQAL